MPANKLGGKKVAQETIPEEEDDDDLAAMDGGAQEGIFDDLEVNMSKHRQMQEGLLSSQNGSHNSDRSTCRASIKTSVKGKKAITK